MERIGAINERRKKFNPFRVKDRVDSRVAARGGDTSRGLRLVLEVAAVGKADRKVKPLGLAIEMFIIGVGVDPAKNCVPRLALAAAWAPFRANRKHIARACAFL